MNIKCLLLSSQCTLPITGNLVFWAAVTVSTRGWQCHWHCPQASPPFISPDIRHNFKPHSESLYLFLSRDWVSGKSLISRLRLVCTCDQPETAHLCSTLLMDGLFQNSERKQRLRQWERARANSEEENLLDHVVGTCAGTSGGWRTRSGTGFFLQNIVQLVLNIS